MKLYYACLCPVVAAADKYSQNYTKDFTNFLRCFVDNPLYLATSPTSRHGKDCENHFRLALFAHITAVRGLQWAGSSKSPLKPLILWKMLYLRSCAVQSYCSVSMHNHKTDFIDLDAEFSDSIWLFFFSSHPLPSMSSPSQPYVCKK